ncbi:MULTISPECIES: hypothetical protein [unclassified Acinetobacter]|uniref:hypothetical protein n=1 Tax=unclassified Acinetobacter TaxID=196816 RepID=UPI0015D29AF8|nr:MULTISPECIES: hypothetical protein [unclassified Acinetobacter]
MQTASFFTTTDLTFANTSTNLDKCPIFQTYMIYERNRQCLARFILSKHLLENTQDG